MAQPLSALDVLRRYKDEQLPEFFGVDLRDVNQKGVSGDAPLHVACIRGNIPEIAALIQSGADVFQRGEMGDTPLHYAVSHNHVAAAAELLRHGAVPSIRNSCGDSALDIAEQNASAVLVQLLRKFSPDTDP